MGRGADLCLALATWQADHRSRKQNLLLWGDDIHSNDQTHDKETRKLGLIKQYLRKDLVQQAHE